MNNRKILKYVSLLVSLMVAACAPNVLADKDKENATTKNEESGFISTQNKKQTEVLEEQNSKQQAKEKQELEKNKKEKEKKTKNKDQKRKKKNKKEETEIKKEEKKEESEVKKDKEKKKEVEIKKNKEEKEDAKDLTKKKEKNLEKEPEKKDLKEKNEIKSKGTGETKEGEKKEEKVVEFNKKDYEKPGFDLVEVLEKNGCHILNYTHKKLKSPAVVILPKNEQDLENTFDGIYFRIPYDSDKGLSHQYEHVGSPIEKLCNKYGLNVGVDVDPRTTDAYVVFGFRTKTFVPQVLEYLFKELKDPTFLKDGGDLLKKEVHNVVNFNGKKNHIGAVYVEKLEYCEKLLGEDPYDEKGSRFFPGLGSLEEIKKAKVDDIKKIHKEYVHPSNALYVAFSSHDPKKVKEKLDLYDKSWCSFYDGPKKYELKDLIPKFKNNDEFLWHKEYLDHGMFDYINSKDEIKRSKYSCTNIIFFDKKFKADEKDVFRFLTNTSKLFNKEKLKEMGYNNCEIQEIRREKCIVGFAFVLNGDNKESFTKEKLKENCKILMKDFVEKIKNTPKSKRYTYYFPKDDNKQDFITEEDFQRSYSYRALDSMQRNMFKSFLYENNPLSPKYFDLENGKILDSKDRVMKNIDKNIDKLDWLYNVYSKKGYAFFDVYENNGINKKEKYKKEHNLNDDEMLLRNFLEIYYKKAPDKNFVLDRYFDIFFPKYFFDEKIVYDGFVHALFNPPHENGGPIVIKTPKESRDALKNYLQSKTFKKDLKNFKISEKRFEDDKKRFITDIKDIKERYEKTLKDFGNIHKKYKNRLNKLNKEEIKKLVDKDLAILENFMLYSNAEIIGESGRELRKMNKNNGKERARFFEIQNDAKKSEFEKEKATKNYRKVLKKYYNYLYKKFKKTGKTIDKFVESCDGVIKDLSVEEFLKKMKSIKITDFKEEKDMVYNKF